MLHCCTGKHLRDQDGCGLATAASSVGEQHGANLSQVLAQASVSIHDRCARKTLEGH